MTYTYMYFFQLVLDLLSKLVLHLLEHILASTT